MIAFFQQIYIKKAIQIKNISNKYMSIISSSGSKRHTNSSEAIKENTKGGIDNGYIK